MIPASVAVAPRRSSHAAIIGRAAVRALYTELALSPKPGLVSPLDSGAHDDMDMTTFMRSLFALRGYFCAIAAAGAAGADFMDLQALGMRAERRMLEATRGINTHRGAIFSLGLLAGAAGWLTRKGSRSRAMPWAAALPAAGARRSCGRESRQAPAMVSRLSADMVPAGCATRRQPGSRCCSTSLFPRLCARSLKAMSRRPWCRRFSLVMAELDDTNLLHRGGPEGLAFVRAQARAFLEAGGIEAVGWQERAFALHRACIARRLSPGAPPICWRPLPSSTTCARDRWARELRHPLSRARVPSTRGCSIR